MSNPKDINKTTTDLKKVAGGALPVQYESAGGNAGPSIPQIDVHPNFHSQPTLGVDLANVAAGAAAPSPSLKQDQPQLPQAPQKNVGGNVNYADLANMSAGATPNQFGSSPGGANDPQIPEIFPGPSKFAKNPGLSIQDLSNMSAGAGAGDYGSSGSAMPTKPKIHVTNPAVPAQTSGNTDI